MYFYINYLFINFHLFIKCQAFQQSQTQLVLLFQIALQVPNVPQPVNASLEIAVDTSKTLLLKPTHIGLKIVMVLFMKTTRRPI